MAEMAGMDPITVELEGLTIHVSGFVKTVDRRRYKIYGKVVGLNCTVYGVGTEAGWDLFRVVPLIHESFGEEKVFARADHARVDHAVDEVKEPCIRINLSFPPVHAPRPSLVVSNMEAWRIRGGYFASVDRLHWSIVQSYLAGKKNVELLDRAAQAEFIRDEVSKKLLEGAKEKTCFKERLEALRAEVQEEITCQFRESEMCLREEIRKRAEDEGWVVHPKALDVGLAKALEKAQSGALTVGRIWGRPNAVKVSIEEVS